MVDRQGLTWTTWEKVEADVSRNFHNVRKTVAVFRFHEKNNKKEMPLKANDIRLRP